MDYQFVNSSMLLSASYNTSTGELAVTFTNGKPYTYVDVPKSIWDELIAAKSAGAYFNSIKKTLKVKE